MFRINKSCIAEEKNWLQKKTAEGEGKWQG